MLYVPQPSNKQTVALVCEVIGDTRRAENWSSRTLTAACTEPLTAHSVVAVSFYFLLTVPGIIVDMEPAPALGKFYCEAKRAWAHAQGIVYVPIFLRDKLTRTQFEERLKIERAALVEAKRLATDGRVRAAAKGRKRPERPEGYTIADPAIQALIEEETLTRLAVEIKAGVKLRGGAKIQRAAKVRQQVEAEFLARVRDGSVGHQLRSQQSAVAAGR